MFSTKKFIVAVSGGVDSIVLLHKIAHATPPNVRYIVAHVDHGIREDSSEDAEFVRNVAIAYGCDFVETKLQLGKDASELEARTERYAFLRAQMKKYNAEAIVTAHHEDDVLETMILNILRGTAHRGLIGFTQPGIIRPLLHWSKKEIVEYATQHELIWREDSTNSNTKYLRNYVRIHMISKLSNENRKKFLEVREKVIPVENEIATLTDAFLVQMCDHPNSINRAQFVILPFAVQKEIVTRFYDKNSITYDRPMIEKSVLAIKTMYVGKHIELNKTTKLFSLKKSVCIIVEGDAV